MSDYQEVTPEGQDYLRSSEIFQNLTYNSKNVTLAANMAATVTPFAALDGSGLAYLQGQITINTASVSANMTLCTLPAVIVPQSVTYHPVVVLRSGAFVANAVKVDVTTQTVILLTQPQQNDVVCLDSVAFLVNSYR